jgi:hypothetical protein
MALEVFIQEGATLFRCFRLISVGALPAQTKVQLSAE